MFNFSSNAALPGEDVATVDIEGIVRVASLEEGLIEKEEVYDFVSLSPLFLLSSIFVVAGGPPFLLMFLEATRSCALRFTMVGTMALRGLTVLDVSTFRFILNGVVTVTPVDSLDVAVAICGE